MERRGKKINSWTVWMILGIIILFAGIIGIFNPISLSATLIYVVGWFFFIFAVMTLYFAYNMWAMTDKYTRRYIFMQGIIEGFFGLLLIINPFGSMRSIIMVLGFFLILRGISSFFSNGYKMTLFGPMYEGRGTMVFDGILNLFFGLLAFVAPLFMEGLIGFVLAFYLLFIGIELIIIALKFKNLS